MSHDVDIAVIGVGCRFPDAWTFRQFCSNIDNGVVSMRELTDEQLRASGVDEEKLRSPDYVRVGTTLPGVAEFAADFFGYPPREALTMDPQQRIFLEACWEALESAGHPPRADGPLTGVFASSAAGSYSAALFARAVMTSGLAAAVDSLELTVGGEPDFLTSRAAYKLGLRGPAVTVQTACSSSLYAAHYASLSLLSGECDIALVGGATVLEPVRGYRYVPDGGQSVDGYCRSFDARASGTTYSSGVGVVVLRRLSDALADGDPVLAVLRGTAVGNDGAGKAGWAAPSPAGVADVVTAALKVAGVPGDLLRYVEAHGTATPLGDQVELAALTDALRTTTTEVGFCGLGSVKANIGHTGVASGMAGLIKGVHVVRTGTLPPHPAFERPREPELLAESPFFISTSAADCQDPDRHVLVNSIGFGGANAAAVLGPPPPPRRPAAPAGDRVRLVVSARNRVELDRLSGSIADLLDRDELPTGDVSHTLRVGRRGFAERRVVTAPPERLAEALRLPRPPLARSLRSAARRAAIVLPDRSGVPDGLIERLRAALPGGTVVTGDPAPYGGAGWFRIVVGPGETGADQHVLPPGGGTADELDAAVCAAWLHGVPVDWEALAGDRGRRVPLPTYPFERKRFWALDAVPSAPASPRPAPASGIAEAATGDQVDREVLAAWRDLFGDAAIGPDDEFAHRGGTSLMSVQLVMELQERFGVLVNMHRAGGSRATARSVAALVRALLGGENRPGEDRVDRADRMDRMDPDDNGLVDADLQLPLGTLAPAAARGKDILLTGAAGYLGAFLLRELLAVTTRRIYCLVRAATEEEAFDRLRAAAARFLLPAPDPARVHAVPGDLRHIAKIGPAYRNGELERQVGHVVHAAARVVFTEPYQTLREDNVLPMADLLTWTRECGIRDFSYVSTAAATGPAPGADLILEMRDQPLDPRLGGYGVTKWVCERLLDRADEGGMRVRVFRPGLVMSARDSGAVRAKDLIYFVLASGIAVGAHPADDRPHDLAPVDVVARAIAELAMSRGSAGRAYHLIGDKLVSLREMFGMLAEAGLPTRTVGLDEWRRLVQERALVTGNPILSTAALLEIEGNEEGAPALQATGWQPWLRRNRIDPGITGDLLRRGLRYLARTDDLFAALLPEMADGKGGRS
jgi:phthiocerol/phenolphthiocerol synthesis type-I polyketide synthase E